MIYSPWTRRLEGDLQSDFSPIRTEENRNYLIEILGERWLEKRIVWLRNGFIKMGPTNHPIIQRWISDSGSGWAYLELNSLAEDLRLIDKKPNFQTILRDLKSMKEYEATWHVIHCAAFFERGKEGIISKFYPQTSESVPDFSLTIEDEEVPVEAKLLTKSEKNIQFIDWTEILSRQIEESILVDDLIYPVVFIMIKDCRILPDISKINDSVREGLKNFKGLPLKESSQEFNIFILPNPANEDDYFKYFAINILCPRDHSENIRMEGRVKSASKQLKAITSSTRGIVCLGVGPHQDPIYIRDRLVERFKKSQLSGVASVLLMRKETYVKPPKASILDLLSVISNDFSPFQIPGNLKIEPIGLRGKLINDHTPPPNVISAYRNTRIGGKAKHDMDYPNIPNIGPLTKEMLE